MQTDEESKDNDDEVLQEGHRKAIAIFVFFIASELVNRRASCTGCLEAWTTQTDHYCLNYGDGYEDEKHETEQHIRQTVCKLEASWEREALVQKWKEFASQRDVYPTTTPPYFDSDFVGMLSENILNIFLKEPHLAVELYETGNLTRVPELKNLVREAITGTVFDRMEV